MVAAGLLVVLIAGGIVAITGSSSSPSSSSSSSSASSRPSAPRPNFATAERPVPTNRVKGGGTAAVWLHGNTATVSVDAHGLLNAAHLIHIHAGGQGACPPASAARAYHGHRFINTSDGLKYYGGVVASLTQTGGTSPSSYLAFARYPSGGTIEYKRTIKLEPGVAGEIRAGNAVVVIHGINYDGSGVYDDYLGRSDLNTSLTATATAPALCGTLSATGTSPVAFGAITAGTTAAARTKGTLYVASLNPYNPADSVASAVAYLSWCTAPPKVSGAGDLEQ